MTIILARSRVQFSSLQQPQMVSFTRIYYPACCNRQQINQNTTNSSQRSKLKTSLDTPPILLSPPCWISWHEYFGSFRYPFLSRCSEILFNANWLVLSNFKQVQYIKLSHYFITLFSLVHENWHIERSHIECFRLLSVPLTGISLLIAAAGGVLYVGHFHPSLKSDAFFPNSLHSSLNGDKLDILLK